MKGSFGWNNLNITLIVNQIFAILCVLFYWHGYVNKKNQE